MTNSISRRSFLLGTGLLGASAAAAGLTGCAPSSNSLAGTGKGDAKSQLTSSRLIDVADADVAATEECDVVVCGSGSAGTYAAVRAAERGAKVIWLEKTSMKGGTSTVTEGINAPNTKDQVEAGQLVDTQADFESLMGWHSWSAYGPGIWCYLDNAGPAIDWAIEHGAQLFGDGPMFTCFNEEGKWINMGEGMLSHLWAFGETLPNLDFRLETPAVNIVLEDGKVGGVYAQSPDGAITRINAKAVVLATGGFGRNPEMCAERLRVPAERVVFLGFDGQEGDGINMALAAGGLSQAPSAVMFGLSKVREESWDSILSIFTQWPPSWRAPQEEGKTLPMVNEHGKRFYNETLVEECDTSRINTAIASQTKVFTLFDAKHVETYSGFDEFDYGTGIATGEFGAAVEKSPYVHKADTLEELASLMGVDAAALTQTMSDWNARANGDGSHDPFGADAAVMAPVEQGPFYAAEIEACAYSTCGGVRGDYETRVLDENDEPIPGLFVAGLDNGSMYYNDYPYGLHGGSGQASACATGYAAAEAVCKDLGLA